MTNSKSLRRLANLDNASHKLEAQLFAARRAGNADLVASVGEVLARTNADRDALAKQIGW